MPPRAVRVPLEFPLHGLSYDHLTDDEKADWDAAEWGEDVPDENDADAVNK